MYMCAYTCIEYCRYNVWVYIRGGSIMVSVPIPAIIGSIGIGNLE